MELGEEVWRETAYYNRERTEKSCGNRLNGYQSKEEVLLRLFCCRCWKEWACSDESLYNEELFSY